MSTIINPATNKPFEPISHDLYIEVVAERVTRKPSGDRLHFVCPMCGHRNSQSIKKRLALPAENMAAFKCVMCRTLVHVRKRVTGSGIIHA